jgi:hypothetical protein
VARILITGSRDWTYLYRILVALQDHASAGDTVIHGGAKGADEIAGVLWKPYGPVEVYPLTRADWERHGRRAGYLRNQAMVDAGADICLAFIKNNSRGASMCAALAEKAGIPVVYYRENTE